MPLRTKVRRVKKIRHNTRKQRIVGGVLGAMRDAINSGDRQIKNGEENTSFVAIVRSSWRKSVENKVEYIIPNNFLLLKTPNSLLAPTFNVHIGNGPKEQCYLRVAEPNNPSRIKFVEYFVHLNQQWYCMMRIFGINTGMLATLSNIVFYRMENPGWISLTNNSIRLPMDAVIENKMSDLNMLQRTVMKDSRKIFQITKGLQPITDGDDYKILRQFRNGQLINSSVKEEVGEEVGENVFWGMFGM